MASGRPAYGSRFNTGNMESALLARGFHYGSAPDSVVIGWNGGHAAVTLPDGTPVSSGESNHGVRVGGGGAYQPQFSHHMYLPMQAQQMNEAAPAAEGIPPADAPPPAEPGAVELAAATVPPAEGAPVDAPATLETPAAVEALAPAETPAPVEAPATPAGELPQADPVLPLPA